HRNVGAIDVKPTAIGLSAIQGKDYGGNIRATRRIDRTASSVCLNHTVKKEHAHRNCEHIRRIDRAAAAGTGTVPREPSALDVQGSQRLYRATIAFQRHIPREESAIDSNGTRRIDRAAAIRLVTIKLAVDNGQRAFVVDTAAQTIGIVPTNLAFLDSDVVARRDL